jgi:alanyl-tRNA synthetase
MKYIEWSKTALKNPQDILKAVHSMQEENIKLAKQIELC